MYCIFFSFCVCIDTHREKEKEDTFGIWPTERARVQHGVIYGTFNGFFVFAGGEKTKKRGSGAAGRRDDGRGCWRGAGARARDGGGMAGGVPVVLMVCRGATTIKVCLCTDFEAVDGGGVGYFCTV